MRLRTVVTGSRGLPSVLPADLPQGPVGFHRYEPVGLNGSLRSWASCALPDKEFRSSVAWRSIARWTYGVVPACRHADRTISSSKHADVRRMVSEDSARVSAIGLSC